MKPIDKLVAHYKTKTGLGNHLGLAKQTISCWGSYVPPLQALRIELQSKGKFKAIDLVNPESLK